jgi:ankyrin repeat protein
MVSKNSTGVCVAAQFGLLHILEVMLVPQGQEKRAEITTKRNYGETRLYLVAANGYYPTVELLLDEGAGIGVQDGFHGNTLQVASDRNYEVIVKLLLDKGIEDNT